MTLYLVCAQGEETLINADTPEDAVHWARDVCDFTGSLVANEVTPGDPTYAAYWDMHKGHDRQPCPWCDGTGGEAMNPCRRCNGNGDIPA